MHLTPSLLLTLLSLPLALAAPATRDASTPRQTLDSLEVPAGTTLRLGVPGQELRLHVAGSVRILGTVEVRGSLRLEAAGPLLVGPDAQVSADALWLEGGAGEETWVHGRLTARPDAAGRGGSIAVLGERVGIGAQARLTARGAVRGGTIRVGGDAGGDRARFPASARTYVAEGAQLSANASAPAGDGGEIVVWAEEVTRCAGTLDAGDGGAGQGGFVEVSARGSLGYWSQPWVGRNGRILIDPATITITDGGPDASPQADVAFADAGPTTIAEQTLENTTAGQNATIVLQAGSSITIDNMTDNELLCATGVNVVLQTRNDVGLGDSASGGITYTSASDTFTTQGGATLTLEAGAGGTTGAAGISGGQWQTDVGVLALSASGTIAISRADTRVSGINGAAITLVAQGNVSFDELEGSTVSVTSQNGNVSVTGTFVSIDLIAPAGGSVSLNAPNGQLGTAALPIFVSATDRALSTNTATGNGDQFLRTRDLDGIDWNAGTGTITVLGALTGGGGVDWNDVDAAVDVRAGTFTVSATVGTGLFGRAANPLQTAVGTLNVDLSAVNGSVFVAEQDSLVYDLRTGSGALSLRVGTGPLLDTGNTLSTTGALTLTVDTGTLGSAGDVFTLPATSIVTTSTSASNGAQFLALQAALTALAFNAGTGAITLDAANNAITDGDGATDLTCGTLMVTNGNTVGALANPLGLAVVDASIDCSASNASMFLSEADGLTGLDLRAGTGAVTLTSGGAITDGAGSPDVSAASATLTVTSGALGSAGSPLNVLVGSLTTNTSAGNGAQFVTTLATTTALLLNAGTGAITYVTGNLIDTDGTTDVLAGSATLTSTGVFGSLVNPIGTAVTTLTTVSTATNADQFLSEADGLSALDLNAGTGNVVLSAGGAVSDTDGSADVRGTQGTITLTTGDVGSSANPLDTTVTQLSVNTSAGGGSLFVRESDGLSALALDAGAGNATLTAGAAVTDTDGAVDVAAANASLTLSAGGLGSAANPLGTTVTGLTTNTSGGNGAQFVSETNGLSALDLNAGTGDVTLRAGGAITDTDGVADLRCGAAALTLTAGGVGAAANPLGLAVTTLAVDTSAGNGAQFLSEADTATVSAANGLNAGTAAVTLASGRFDVTGTTTASLVTAEGTLGGTGTVGALTLGATGPGTVAPGTSPGVLTAGSTSFAAGSTFSAEVGGTGPGAGAGFHDQLVVNGSVTIDGAAVFSPVVFGGFAPSNGDVFVLIQNDGSDAINGTFSGLPQNGTLTFLGATARASYTGGDGNDFTVTVFGSTDLGVSVSVDDAAPSVGQTVTFTIRVTNNGPLDATGVSLDDALPTGLTFQSATPSQGSFTSPTWTVGSLANGSTATLTLTARVDAGTGGSTLTNTTSNLTANQGDGTTSNNTASVSLTVTARPGGGSSLTGLNGSGTVVIKGSDGCALRAGQGSPFALALWAVALLLLAARRRSCPGAAPGVPR